VNKLLELIDRFKFAIIAAVAAYVILFIYLTMGSYTEYFPIEPFFDGAVVEIPEDEVKLKPENIQVPPDFAGEVKSISRDVNDKRKKSYDKWYENQPTQDAEQSVRDYEKKLFEESGGESQRKKIQQEMEDRKREREKEKTTAQKTDETNNSGGGTAYKGNVMVDWSLSGRSPHQNNNWYVRNPGYTCGYGSAGRVTIHIKVNQNGDVTLANYDASQSSGANACMIEQAVKYAKLSRFNYSGSSSKIQEGTIVYTFVSQ